MSQPIEFIVVVVVVLVVVAVLVVVGVFILDVVVFCSAWSELKALDQR